MKIPFVFQRKFAEYFFQEVWSPQINFLLGFNLSILNECFMATLHNCGTPTIKHIIAMTFPPV